jgi:type II secretory pathway pseudopilin PulG
MHFDQNVIIVIVAAVIGISRLVARIAENAREQSQRRNKQAQARGQQEQLPHPQQPPPVFARPKTDEERVREFLEALGAPAGTTPPPKIQPRTDIPPRPVAPIQPPPLSRPFSPVILRPAFEKARKTFTPPRPAPVPEASSETAEPGAWLREEEKIEEAAARFETATRTTADEGVHRGVEGAISWRNALRSRESVRTAIVLREILGPPRALREIEAI